MLHQFLDCKLHLAKIGENCWVEVGKWLCSYSKINCFKVCFLKNMML